MALVIANLMLAGAFVVLAGRPHATDVHHILSLPAEATMQTSDIRDAPLFMLCDRKEIDGKNGTEAYPVAIGKDKFLCWPLQLRQADLSGGPILHACLVCCRALLTTPGSFPVSRPGCNPRHVIHRITRECAQPSSYWK